jgi:hypothetical protein
MAAGPKKADTAITAVCRYEPAVACSIPLRSTKAKNTPGEKVNHVEKVRSALRSMIMVVEV